MAATPDETLADERRRRTAAAASAFAAALLTLAGSLVVLAAIRSFPVVHVLDALRSNLGQAPAGPGPNARALLYFDDHVLGFAAFQLVPALAAAALGVALTFLYRSTAARNPQVGKLALIGAVAGSVLLVVAALVTTVSLTLDVHAFADSANHSEQAARDAFASPVRDVANALSVLGRLALTVGIVAGALNAMRVGLLTRFTGVLGMIVGVLFLIPQFEGQVPFVKIFWLAALGLLFLQRWPGPMPPAWVTGEAQPWPTQQEIREQREAARAERGAAGLEPTARRPRRGRAEPPETPAPEPPRSAKPHSSSKKKKRKRR